MFGKRSPCLCLLAAVVGFWAVQAKAAEASPPASATRSSPVLSGCEYDYPPFCIVKDDKQADGFSVQLLRAALKAMGREVTFKPGPWAEIKQDLADGRLEVLPMVARSPKREDEFDFTFPYLTMHGTIVVREETTDIHGPEDLKGKRVAVLQEDIAHEYLRRAGLGAVIAPRPSFATAMRELSAGQHDAVVIQKLLALHLMKEANLKNLRAVGPPLTGYTQSFCFAVRKGNWELLSLLNEGLSIVMADGTLRHLHAEWFSHLETLAKAKSRIVVGGDGQYPPYEYLDENGQPAGYNVDLTRAIAEQMGLLVDIQLGPWDKVREGLQNGKIDIVQGMYYSAERDRDLDFSPAHLNIQQVIVVRKGSPELSDMQDLAGKSILVQAGDIMEDLAIQHGYQKQLVRVGSMEEALRLLAAGQGDCALAGRVLALHWIQKNGWRNLKVSRQAVLAPEYCYAAPHRNQKLLAEFAEGLAAIKRTGQYRAIQTKWLGPYEDSRIEAWTIVKYALLGALPLGALLAGSLLWSRALKAQVLRRTRELHTETEVSRKTTEQLRRSEARLARAQEIAHLGSWELDLANNELSWSDEVYRIFGLEPQEFGASYEAFLERVHPEDRSAVDAAYSGSTREGRDSYEIDHRVVRKATGEIRWVHEKCTHIRNADGRILSSLGMVLDITERKRAEEQLRQLNVTLEQRVAERTAEAQRRAEQLQALTARLTQAEQKERQRLATILHDHLQQLLVGTKFHLGMVRNQRSDPTLRQSLDEIDSLLDQSLETSRNLTVDLSPPILTHGNMTQVLRWLADWMRSKHGLNVRLEADEQANPQAHEIRVLLFQAVRELLFNVVKHARVNEATVELCRLDDQQVRVTVCDKGVGFQEMQADVEARNGSGFGLLAIRERLTWLNGSFEIRGEPGKGTCATLIAPMVLADGSQADAESVMLAPAAQGSSTSTVGDIGLAGRKTRILLADDHAVMRDGLGGLLQQQVDMAVVGKAADGQEAVELAQQLRPDVVIMDVSMPRLDGVEATRRIKAHLPGVRVIALSMFNEEGMTEAMKAAGAERCFAKTSNPETLIAAIRECQAPSSEAGPRG